MKKVELLAPAGDQESLIAAVQNGADAVYLSGKSFGARAFAKNFDNEQLLWAVHYAHLHQVKIFVTVNTLYKDQEFSELLQYIDYLYQIQVDAIIIQDIGLIHVIRKAYPDFEIHISTQASIMNKYGVKYFENLGAKRIVLARENTLNEIQSICQNTGIDVEVFVHGALCVCYSGQCLMSSYIGKRSGNRGACAQPCRLPYRLQKNNQIIKSDYPFLLSPKDLMTIEHIGKLIDAGVYSFKIEGRMKRPEYVGSVVRAYRHAIDAYLNKKNIDLKHDIEYMKAMFNRDYTQGFVFQDQKIVKGDYSGNKGIIIGNVLRYLKKSKRVVCQLNDTLYQGDSIVFEAIDKGRPVNKIYKNHQLVNHAEANDIVEIEFNYPVYEGNIRRTIYQNVIQEIQKTYQKENIQLPVHMLFKAHEHEYATLTIDAFGYYIEKKSSILVETAHHQSLTKERITQQLSKLGNTPFVLNSIKIDIDNHISLPIKEINQMRRDSIEELSHQMMNKKIHSKKEIYHFSLQKNLPSYHTTHVLVSNLEQLKVAIQYPIDQIYYPYQQDALQAFQICQKQNKEMVLFIPRICKDQDIKEILNSEIYSLIKKVVVNEYGSYFAFSDKEVIIGTGFNVYNSYSCLHFSELKILSLELSFKQMKQLKTNLDQCIFQIYGKTENMISDYCPISQFYFQKQIKNCQRCKEGNYSLVDRKDMIFDLMMDEKCRMHLLNSQTLYIDQIQDIDTQGIFLHFTNEYPNIVKEVLNDYFENVIRQKKSLIKTKRAYTLGYFKK